VVSTSSLPRRVGRYELVDKIGTGGMAEVFRARRTGLAGQGREFAVKQLTEALSRDPVLVSMFVDEAKIASQLSHKNIVEVVEFGVEENGRVYMVLEYIDGHDLRWVLATAARAQYWVPVEFSLTIARDLCRALGHAHEARGVDGQRLEIVHRDVSHSNVFLSRKGEVKLADFGIARARGRQSQTRTGLVKGKLGYLSPEQVRAETLDGRSDLFAATVVLWELLTQRRMFVGETDFKTMLAVCSETRTPPSALRPGLPSSVDELVLKGLQVKRENRYSSAREMELAIEKVAREHDLALGEQIVVQVIEYLDQFSKAFPKEENTGDLEQPKKKPGGVVAAAPVPVPPAPAPAPVAAPATRAPAPKPVIEAPSRRREEASRAAASASARSLASGPPSDVFAKPWTEDEPTEAGEPVDSNESEPAVIDEAPVRPAHAHASALSKGLTSRQDRVRAAQASFQNAPIYLRSSGEVRPLFAFDSVLFAIDPRIRKNDDVLSADRQRWMPLDEFARLAELELATELKDAVKPIAKSPLHGARVLGVLGELALNGFTGRLIIDREEDRQVCLLQTGGPVGVLSSQPEHQLLSALLSAKAIRDARSAARCLHQVLVTGNPLQVVLEREFGIPADAVSEYRRAIQLEVFDDLIRPGDSVCATEKRQSFPGRAFVVSNALELLLPSLMKSWSDDVAEAYLGGYHQGRIQVMPGLPLLARMLRLKQEAGPVLRRVQSGRTVAEVLGGFQDRPDQMSIATRLVLLFIETGAISLVE
jgi:serine/threonine-protein kinase